MTGSIEFENGEIVDLDDLVDAWLPVFDAIAAADPLSTWEPGTPVSWPTTSTSLARDSSPDSAPRARTTVAPP